MSNKYFDEAFNFVIENEGGYSNNPHDPGAETNFGISKRAHPTLDIKNLTKNDAKTIYKQDYWEPYPFNFIRYRRIRIKLFDLSVNLGISWATIIIQKTLKSIGTNIKEDGKLGQKTINAINSYFSEEKLLEKFKQKAIEHYKKIAENNPNMKEFLNGWINRANR